MAEWRCGHASLSLKKARQTLWRHESMASAAGGGPPAVAATPGFSSASNWVQDLLGSSLAMTASAAAAVKFVATGFDTGACPDFRGAPRAVGDVGEAFGGAAAAWAEAGATTWGCWVGSNVGAVVLEHLAEYPPHSAVQGAVSQFLPPGVNAEAMVEALTTAVARGGSSVSTVLRAVAFTTTQTMALDHTGQIVADVAEHLQLSADYEQLRQATASPEEADALVSAASSVPAFYLAVDRAVGRGLAVALRAGHICGNAPVVYLPLLVLGGTCSAAVVLGSTLSDRLSSRALGDANRDYERRVREAFCAALLSRERYASSQHVAEILDSQRRLSAAFQTASSTERSLGVVLSLLQDVLGHAVSAQATVMQSEVLRRRLPEVMAGIAHYRADAEMMALVLRGLVESAPGAAAAFRSRAVAREAVAEARALLLPEGTLRPEDELSLRVLPDFQLSLWADGVDDEDNEGGEVLLRVSPTSGDLALLPGRLAALVAPSGAGKSSLLRVLAGFTTPNEGSVLLCGHPVARLAAADMRECVAYVSQDGPRPRGPLRRFLLFGLEGGASDASLTQALARVDLEKDLDFEFDHLSGGERQRASLSRLFLLGRTRLWLLDEPTSSLDERSALKVMGAVLDEARSRGVAMLCATHQTAVASLFEWTWSVDTSEKDDRIREVSTRFRNPPTVAEAPTLPPAEDAAADAEAPLPPTEDAQEADEADAEDAAQPLSPTAPAEASQPLPLAGAVVAAAPQPLPLADDAAAASQPPPLRRWTEPVLSVLPAQTGTNEG